MTKLNPPRKNLFTVAFALLALSLASAGSRARSGAGTRSRSDPSELYSGRRSPHRPRHVQTQAWDGENSIPPRDMPADWWWLTPPAATAAAMRAITKCIKTFWKALNILKSPSRRRSAGAGSAAGGFQSPGFGNLDDAWGRSSARPRCSGPCGGRTVNRGHAFHHSLCELGLKESQHAVPSRQRYR